MWSFRLKTRYRVGIKGFSAIYSKPITTACADVDSAGKISIRFRCQRIDDWLRASAVFHNNIDFSGFWRPNAKMCLIFADYFSADRVVAFYLRHGH